MFFEQEIEKRLKVVFRNKALLHLAFIHRSFCNENKGLVPGHNERLEFLGDAVLGLILAEYLYAKYPDLPEGELSSMRALLSGATGCLGYLQRLDVEEFLLLGKGEQRNAGRGRETILADLLEAVMGAIYLDQGYVAAQQFFFLHFKDEVERLLAFPARNAKAELQDYAQKLCQKPPTYEVVEESGPPHSKHFVVAAVVDGRRVGLGKGSSKKEAEQSAALDALHTISRREHGNN